MATAKKPEEINELDEQQLEDSMTVVAAEKPQEYQGPRVRIFLPKLEDDGGQGLKVDQYEHVTIANEAHETHYRILRGEWVDVPVPVFVVLKEKYPQL